MAKATAFTAYDQKGRKRHRITAPVQKISRHVLRKEEWRAGLSTRKTTKMAKIKGARTAKDTQAKRVTRILDLLRYDSDELECLHCSRLGDETLCSSKCYCDFTKKHLNPTSTHIQIRGPGPLEYSAHTTTRIPKHAWLGEYLGELRPLFLSASQDSNYWLEIPGVCAIDAANMGNWTRFMNSNCTPNVKLWGGYLGKRHVVLFQALRDIMPGEELCFQYGRRYFEKAGFACRCGAEGGRVHLPGAKGKKV